MDGQHLGSVQLIARRVLQLHLSCRKNKAVQLNLIQLISPFLLFEEQEPPILLSEFLFQTSVRLLDAVFRWLMVVADAVWLTPMMVPFGSCFCYMFMSQQPCFLLLMIFLLIRSWVGLKKTSLLFNLIIMVLCFGCCCLLCQCGSLFLLIHFLRHFWVVDV